MLNKVLDTRLLAENGSNFMEGMISAKFLRGDVLLRGKLQIDAKKLNVDIFKSTMSIPLISKTKS